MLIDIGPLRRNTAFRRLFASQFISGLGTMVSYVAVPWQLYQLTHSNAQVGLLGLVQLVPVVVCGLLGGAVADRVDRKRLLIASEALMARAWRACWPMPIRRAQRVAIYALVAVLQGASGFHRPALEALTQKLARPEEFAAVAALSSVRGTVGMVAGPAHGRTAAGALGRGGRLSVRLRHLHRSAVVHLPHSARGHRRVDVRASARICSPTWPRACALRGHGPN